MKYLPESGVNLFQKIKKLVKDYEAENGEGSSINIAVGEPDTNPPLTLRKIISEVVLRDVNRIHNYWDNGAPEGFVEGMIQHHAGIDINEYSHLKGLALPGEKPMLCLLPIACGANRTEDFPNSGYMRNAPAYDMISIWADYLGEESFIWSIYSADQFRLRVSNIPSTVKPPRLIVVVKPGNPCPVGASREEWEEVIGYCIKNKIRLVNDGAYTGVVHGNHVPLSKVAKDYPELEWIEFFSISKTMSACGWRMGAAIGTIDFVDELIKIKGNNDSGAFGPGMVAIGEYFQHPDSKAEMKAIQELYNTRLKILIPILENIGLKLACPSDAGFFTLWHCPVSVNNRSTSTSEEFNKEMINAIGLVGVPFVGSKVDGKAEQFIRYSVCAPLEDVNFINRLADALEKVRISYS